MCKIELFAITVYPRCSALKRRVCLAISRQKYFLNLSLPSAEDRRHDQILDPGHRLEVPYLRAA